MVHPEILTKYQEVLEGTLGAIAAHHICTSKDSSKVIRDCSKQLDALSIDLRRALVEQDKLLSKDTSNEQSN